MALGRVLGVTAFLGALGGLAGALGGMLLAVGLSIALDFRLSWDAARAYLFAAGLGAVVGMVAGPALTWLLLRTTPIWRAIGETAIGAGLAATAGLATQSSIWIVCLYAVGGATLAALRLRAASPKPAGAIAAGDRDPE